MNREIRNQQLANIILILAFLICCIPITLLAELEEPPEPPESQTIVVPHPPLASLITIGQPNEKGYTTVTGAPGAIEPDALVAIACLDTATLDVIEAHPDGSFETSVYAPPGTFIQIKHAYPFVPLEEVELSFGGTVPGDVMALWLNATSGTILPVPVTHTGSDGGRPFALAASIASESGEGYWTFEGILGPENRSEGTLRVPISGKLRITTPAIRPGMDLSGIEVLAHFNLFRFFDQDGRQVPVNQTLASNFMSPTGLPISRGAPNGGPLSVETPVTGWRQVGEDILEAEISTVLSIPVSTEPGIYRPRLVLSVGPGIPLGPPANSSSYFMRPGFTYGGGFLPPVRIGEPAEPRLVWTLLTDTLNNGARGTVAREDKATFGLIPLTVFQTDRFIIPRTDPRSGEPISCRLEPFMPLIALTDRGVPNPPLIPFKLPSGQVEVIVGKPDGTIDTLGPASFQQSTSRTPAYPDARLRDNNGGAMQDVYQLTTLDEAFAYIFDQYGRHAITLYGTVEDLWGNTYHGSGTYDVYVARLLKVDTGMLPTTPFEVGDVFAPTVQVYPRVPVGGDFEPIIISGPGEYRVDLTATYTSPDEIMWMGSATWGGVVETPNTPLIAHGRRGIDTPEDEPLWFFHSQLGFSGVAHTYYPYSSGDIFWGTEAITDVGAEAILPWITIQDSVEEVYGLIRQRWESTSHSNLFPWETLEERIAAHEAPLVSTTSDESDLLWSPDRVDQYGYAYRSSQRPGARVHETMSEDELGIAYWRFNATYGDQVGVEGDLPGDLKWEFGGAVYRYLPRNINHYAIYGSLWVLIPEQDPLGPRVMPPFQGQAGGPNGGPILTLKGEDIDLFFLPRSGGPDRFSRSAIRSRSPVMLLPHWIPNSQLPSLYLLAVHGRSAGRLIRLATFTSPKTISKWTSQGCGP